MIYQDILVIGAGLAGLRAAIGVNQKNVRVGVITKVHPLRSHSIAAQGGVNAALGNNPRGAFDTVELHAFDTVKGSDYLADQPAVMKFTSMAPVVIREMEHWGCPFSRTVEGRIAQRPFGGAGFPRTCFAADKMGHMLLHTLYEQAIRFEQASERQDFHFFEEWMVTRLVVEDGVCRGVIAFNLASGKLEAFMSEAVIFATGGSGRIYKPSTNAVISTGLGMAIPYRAGVPLKDMEFIQFHPTTLLGSGILITEGCRGEGAFLTNASGERFLSNYSDSAKAMEIAPRDIVARNMQREIDQGRGVSGRYIDLDLRHLGERKIRERLPGIRDLAMNFAGVDPIFAPIPVRPGQHYTMGGIDTDANGASVVPGLYAAGECACVSVHGANRLGGNSLLETLVFGKIAGESAADYVLSKTTSRQGDKALESALKDEEAKFAMLVDGRSDIAVFDMQDELGSLMNEKVGIFRTEEKLRDAQVKINDLREKFKKVRVGYGGKTFNQALIAALELEGTLDVADAVASGALARRESRGSHFREDHPKRNDAEFMYHTLARYRVDGPAALDPKAVELGHFEPKERKY